MDVKEQILGIVRNQINELDDCLDSAKLHFADTCLSEEDWHNRNDKKINCKMYQAQVEILEKIERLIEDNIIPRPMGAVV
ncbi:MAG TPA: hypothetical protein P5556_10760 [Candidatus Gastranaerophilales bacterium]|nr:hypothetical protein [Candidatus Gastranaerophilales bacterium]